MPFQSKKQRAYLAINNPKVAKKLAKHKVAKKKPPSIKGYSNSPLYKTVSKKRRVTKNKIRRVRSTIGVKG